MDVLAVEGSAPGPLTLDTTIEVSIDDYRAGVLRLPVDDGIVSVRTPDTHVHEVSVSGGVTTDLALFVWDVLAPNARVRLVRNDAKAPIWVLVEVSRRRPDQTSGVGKRRRIRHVVADTQAVDREVVRALCESAIERYGEPVDIERVWSFCAHLGVEVPLRELYAVAREEFWLDEEAQLWRIRDPAEHPRLDVQWDHAWVADWLLEGPVEPQPLDPTSAKRRPSSLDGVEYHMREISHPILTRQEEAELSEKIRRGLEAQRELRGRPLNERADLALAIREGDEAKEIFVRRNLRLVVSNARRYRKMVERCSALDLGDLVQAGYLGLIRAAEKFEGERGTKFSTYATWWIRQAIQREVANNCRTVRLPVHIHDEIKRMRVAKRKLVLELQRSPSIVELARRLGVDAARIEELERIDQEPMAIDELIARELTDADDPLVPRSEGEFGAVMDAGFLRRLVERSLDRLGERERELIILRFGLETADPRTLEEVGRHFNLTRERIRQIQNRALKRLRATIRREDIVEFLDPERLVDDEGANDESAAGKVAEDNDAGQVPSPRGGHDANRSPYDGPRSARTSGAGPTRSGSSAAPSPSRAAASNTHDASHASRSRASRHETFSAHDMAPNLVEAVSQRFGVDVRGMYRRFQDPGWFYTGQVEVTCPRCGTALESFRRPYDTSQGRYHYWGLLCLTCKVLLAPEDLDRRRRQRLYRSSRHRPVLWRMKRSDP